MQSLREASFISTSLQGILYGFSVFMFFLTLWILLKHRERRWSNHGMTVIACSLQVLATAQLVVDILRLWQGFASIEPMMPGGPEQYFSDVSQSTFVIKSCLYHAQTLFLDGVVIYRAFVVWQNIYVTIILVLCWFALLVTCIALNIAFVNAGVDVGNIFATTTGRWITTVYSMTLVTNLSASCLIAFRVWRVHRQTTKYTSNSRLGPVLRVVIEFGAIYSVTIVAALISFLANSPAVYVILDMISPIIVIVFNLIIIRIELASVRRLPIIGTLVHQSTAPERSGRENFSSVRAYGVNREYEMKALEVEVTQYFETEADSSYIAEANQKKAKASEGDSRVSRSPHSSRPL